jgi:tRNA (cmo5U34)-methyltransferase
MTSHFDDPDFVRRYTEGPGRFVPGYQIMQRMAAQLIGETIGRAGDVLVLGAGGGLEIEAFARLEPNWRFIGVDPAKSMLDAARALAEQIGAGDRVRWHEGYVFDAPSGPFDAATCLLTLHFVPDDGGKLDTLRAIRERLKPDAPFVLVDLCMDKGAKDHELRVARYQAFALNSGAEAKDVAETVNRVRNVINTVSPARDEELLAGAGFRGVDLFFAGLSWRGWLAHA